MANCERFCLHKIALFTVDSAAQLHYTMKSGMYVRQFRAILYFKPEIALHPRWITL